MADQPDEIERLRAENQRLRAEVERLRAELQRLGKYLAAPPAATAPAAREADVEWVYRRGDLEDDLGDD
jgi:cell division septum initiation protein DivIVA